MRGRTNIPHGIVLNATTAQCIAEESITAGDFVETYVETSVAKKYYDFDGICLLPDGNLLCLHVESPSIGYTILDEEMVAQNSGSINVGKTIRADYSVKDYTLAMNLYNTYAFSMSNKVVFILWVQDSVATKYWYTTALIFEYNENTKNLTHVRDIVVSDKTEYTTSSGYGFYKPFILDDNRFLIETSVNGGNRYKLCVNIITNETINLDFYVESVTNVKDNIYLTRKGVVFQDNGNEFIILKDNAYSIKDRLIKAKDGTLYGYNGYEDVFFVPKVVVNSDYTITISENKKEFTKSLYYEFFSVDSRDIFFGAKGGQIGYIDFEKGTIGDLSSLYDFKPSSTESASLKIYSVKEKDGYLYVYGTYHVSSQYSSGQSVFCIKCILKDKITVGSDETKVVRYKTKCHGVAKQSGVKGDTIEVYYPSSEY